MATYHTIVCSWTSVMMQEFGINKFDDIIYTIQSCIIKVDPIL